MLNLICLYKINLGKARYNSDYNIMIMFTDGNSRYIWITTSSCEAQNEIKENLDYNIKADVSSLNGIDYKLSNVRIV